MDSLAQVQVLDDRGCVRGVVVHVVSVRHLTRAAVAAAIVRNDAVSMTNEEQHLGIPVIGAERPAVMEHDGLTLAPIFIEELYAIRSRDCAHDRGSSLVLAFVDNSGRGSLSPEL